MEPREVAEFIMHGVAIYCYDKRYDEEVVKCFADHSPDELNKFVYSIYPYIPEEESKDLQNVLTNSNISWDEVKKEYEKLWNGEMVLRVGSLLSGDVATGYEGIMQNAEISDACKARRLKAYAKVLKEFGDAIKRALKEQKPLPELELFDWFDKLGDTAFGLKNYDYYDMIGYDIGFYVGLNDDGKLKVLSILLDEIDNILWNIDHKLPELEALTNES